MDSSDWETEYARSRYFATITYRYTSVCISILFFWNNYLSQELDLLSSTCINHCYEVVADEQLVIVIHSSMAGISHTIQLEYVCFAQLAGSIPIYSLTWTDCRWVVSICSLIDSPGYARQFYSFRIYKLRSYPARMSWGWIFGNISLYLRYTAAWAYQRMPMRHSDSTYGEITFQVWYIKLPHCTVGSYISLNGQECDIVCSTSAAANSSKRSNIDATSKLFWVTRILICCIKSTYLIYLMTPWSVVTKKLGSC